MNINFNSFNLILTKDTLNRVLCKEFTEHSSRFLRAIEHKGNLNTIDTFSRFLKLYGKRSTIKLDKGLKSFVKPKHCQAQFYPIKILISAQQGRPPPLTP